MKDSGVKLLELDKAIIDEYFLNGFCGYKAVRSIRNNSIVAAKSMFNKILKDRKNQEYIQEKRLRLKEQTDIQNEIILKELINWSYVDISDFIGLTIDELKSLPSDVKRCIQSFKVTKRTYKDRSGEQRTDEIVEIKLIDKTKAMEMVNKHVGFYEKNNRQKKNKINLEKLDTVTLNTILQVISNNSYE